MIPVGIVIIFPDSAGTNATAVSVNTCPDWLAVKVGVPVKFDVAPPTAVLTALISKFAGNVTCTLSPIAIATGVVTVSPNVPAVPTVAIFVIVIAAAGSAAVVATSTVVDDVSAIISSPASPTVLNVAVTIAERAGSRT